MADVTHEQVEAFFISSGLKFSRVQGQAGLWELGFMMKHAPFTIQIDNGIGHPGFLSVTCPYIKALTNRVALFQDLLKKTSQVVFAKFGLTEDGDVIIRASVPRDMRSNPVEKIKMSMGAVLQAADQWYMELLTLAAGD